MGGEGQEKERRREGAAWIFCQQGSRVPITPLSVSDVGEALLKPWGNCVDMIMTLMTVYPVRLYIIYII